MSGLKRHKQIHSWGKPFECIECGKTVCWSTNLIRHSLIHTGQKPYECGACGKAFSCSSSLRHHQRMHSDSSPPNVTEDRRPLTTTHASLTLSELLLGKDSLNVTCEGNFCHKKCLLQDLIIYTKEKLHKSLDCKTNKQTNKQTHSYHRIQCHLKSNISSRPSLISPLKIHPGKSSRDGVGVGSCFTFVQGT